MSEKPIDNPAASPENASEEIGPLNSVSPSRQTVSKMTAARIPAASLRRNRRSEFLPILANTP
jgi:hypothetical protein